MQKNHQKKIIIKSKKMHCEKLLGKRKKCIRYILPSAGNWAKS